MGGATTGAATRAGRGTLGRRRSCWDRRDPGSRNLTATKYASTGQASRLGQTVENMRGEPGGNWEPTMICWQLELAELGILGKHKIYNDR